MVRVILVRRWHLIPQQQDSWFKVFDPARDDASRAAKAVLTRYTREGKGLKVALLIHHRSTVEQAQQLRNTFRQRLARAIMTQARRGLNQKIWGVETHIPGWALRARSWFPSERPRMEEEFRQWIASNLLKEVEDEMLPPLEEELLALESAPQRDNPHFEEQPEVRARKRVHMLWAQAQRRAAQVRSAVARAQLFASVEDWLEPLLTLGLEMPDWFQIDWLYHGGAGKAGIHPAFLFIVACLRGKGRQATVANRLGLAPDHSLVRKTLAAMKRIEEGENEAQVLEELGLDQAVYHLATGNTVSWEVGEEEPAETTFDPIAEAQEQALLDTLQWWGLSPEEVEALPPDRRAEFDYDVWSNFAANLPSEQRRALLEAFRKGGNVAARSILRV